MRYRKKPIVIEAVQWDGTAEGATPIINWMLENNTTCRYIDTVETVDPQSIYIDTLEGTMRCSTDDWVIRGVSGEFYPCKPTIFDATYEPAE